MKIFLKGILINLREKKLFNVKVHNSDKLKVNIIFGLLCSGIERRESL